jgi:hypothetical protein
MSSPGPGDVEVAAFKVAAQIVDRLRTRDPYEASYDTERERAIHKRAGVIARTVVEPRQLIVHAAEETFTARWAEPDPPELSTFTGEGKWIYYQNLRKTLPSCYYPDVTDDEVRQIRDEVRRIHCLYVGTLDHDHKRLRSTYSVVAPTDDARRWHAATETVLTALETAQEQWRLAHLHCEDPVPFRAWLVWTIRYFPRNWRLRLNYDTTVKRLHAMVLAALRDFDEQASDLTDFIMAERERRERDRREHQRQDRKLRAIAMGHATDAPVWAYVFHDGPDGRGKFRIALLTAEGERLEETTLTQTGLTPKQVQAALTKERSKHPYTVVEWYYRTDLTLREWHTNDSIRAWERLTGQLINTVPRHPNDPPTRRRHIHGAYRSVEL